MSKLIWPVSGVSQLTVWAKGTVCLGCECQGALTDTRFRLLRDLLGPVRASVPIRHCNTPDCEGAGTRIGRELEMALSPPHWSVTWSLFAWMGHRRFCRHWSVPQIHHELEDRFELDVSPDWIEHYLRKYQILVAGMQSDIPRLRTQYNSTQPVILTIDGLQPEKGHETLYVVRELSRSHVWFASPLVSSATSEIRELFVRAQKMAQALGVTVRAWMSDKQQAFLACSEDVFPGVPHRLCANHFLRDLAQPILERDSHTKVELRKKIRGLREVELPMLQQVKNTGLERNHEDSNKTAEQANLQSEPSQEQRQCQAVLDYCAVIRGILTDDQGGPLEPNGVRMDTALKQVERSLERCMIPVSSASTPPEKTAKSETPNQAQQGVQTLLHIIQQGRKSVSKEMAETKRYSRKIRLVWQCLQRMGQDYQSSKETFEKLTQQYRKSRDAVLNEMSRSMASWQPGLFAGGDLALPSDNLALERAFRQPKGHARRIHGHAHAGTKIVRQGPTLMLVLDAHNHHPKPFSARELLPYLHAQIPNEQLQAERRGRFMSKARSRKKRPQLLNHLERHFRTQAG